MAKYFTIEELCRSMSAAAMGITNNPDPASRANMKLLVELLLDPVREKWGKRLMVTSGYRCPLLNKAVGGAASSQHVTGQAADITAGSRKENKTLFSLIREGDFPFDQLIWEKGDQQGPDWIHVSYSERHRRQVLKL